MFGAFHHLQQTTVGRFAAEEASLLATWAASAFATGAAAIAFATWTATVLATGAAAIVLAARCLLSLRAVSAPAMCLLATEGSSSAWIET